jgi:ribokinase
MAHLVVIGSSNTDLVVKTERFPKPGETLVGGDFFLFQGGKGANQAVAASRMGAEVSFLSKVGNDLFGKQTKKSLEKEGISTQWVEVDTKKATGIALITVNTQGENTIVVAPGANASLSPTNIQASLSQVPRHSFLLCQLETPIDTISFLSNYAQKENKNLILNPAPAQALPEEIYQNLFLITPNETEAALLTELPCDSEEDYAKIAQWFRKKGVQNVLITLGEKGSFFQNSSMEFLLPARKVQAVDSTAAGDVFNGSLAVALAEGMSWKDAILLATQAASISVTRMGAQNSAPFRSELV